MSSEETEERDNKSAYQSTNSLAELDQIDIALNDEVNDEAGHFSMNLLQNSLTTENGDSENMLLFAQEDGNLADNESDAKDCDCKRTNSSLKVIADKRNSKEESLYDSLEQEFVDAESINGIEMQPSFGANNDDYELSGLRVVNNSSRQIAEETVTSRNIEPTDNLTRNINISNGEDNLEEVELGQLTDGPQNELLSYSVDPVADFSSGETTTSSEVPPITSSGNQLEVVTTQPVSSRNSVTDGSPIPPPRKAKKKGVPKGLSSSSLGGCFPMACAGNVSPTFNLSRVDSVYGGSIRSMLVICLHMSYFTIFFSFFSFDTYR